MQAKAEKALAADKLDPKWRFIQCLRPLQRTNAAQVKDQVKLVELEEAAKKAAQAVEEAKQKAGTPRGNRWAPTSDSVAHLHKSLCHTFQALASRVELNLSSNNWMRQSHAFRACWLLPRPHPRRTCATTTSARLRRNPCHAVGLRSRGSGSFGDGGGSWCASYEGWRFLEADKCATFPFSPFGTVLRGAVAPQRQPN